MRILTLCLLLVPFAAVAATDVGSVELSGQVLTAFDDWSFYLASGTNVLFANVPTPGRNISRSGDLVHLRGHYGKETGKPARLAIEEMRVTGHAPLPKAVETSGAMLFRGDVREPFIHVRGVVSSVWINDIDPNWYWITLRTPTYDVCAAFAGREHRLDDFRNLLDAEVVLHGSVSESGIARRHAGQFLMLFGKDAVNVLSPAPTDPFVGQMDVRTRSLHRQLIQGIVLARTPDRLFIRLEDGSFLIASPSTGQPAAAAGDHVRLAGFIDRERFNLRMTETLVRICPKLRTNESPERLAPNQLFSDFYGRDSANTRYNGRVIGLRGAVVNTPANLRTADRLQLENGRWNFSVDLTGVRDRLGETIESGSVLEVCGVCLAECDSGSASEPYAHFRGFTLVPRTAEDITIIRRPPWWTPIRLMIVIGILLAVIVVILIWNRALKVLSERRGRELAREQLRHATSELKVEERTRLAVELHDSISQTLTGVALQIDAAQGSSENPSVAGRFLDTARAMLASCRQELRCCIWDLKSRTFDENDMTEAVTRTLAPHLGETEAQVRFSVPRSILSESATHDILRIIRELATNAIRHGQAKHLRIAGECRDGLVRFSVRDDGSGFDPHSVLGPAQGHFGLQGIRERISGRNGDMTVESTLGKGTKITVAFAPDEKDEDEP